MKHPDSPGAQPAHSATRILADIAHLLEAEAGSTARVRRALQLLRQIVPSDCCALLEATSSHRRLTVEPEMGSDEESALVGLLAHYLADLSEEVGSISMPPPQIREEMGARSYLVAPLIGLGCVNGLLFVGRGERDAFTEHDLSLVSIIAAQLAAYVMKLQLSARLEERLASLAGIASSLTINQPMRAFSRTWRSRLSAPPTLLPAAWASLTQGRLTIASKAQSVYPRVSRQLGRRRGGPGLTCGSRGAHSIGGRQSSGECAR